MANLCWWQTRWVPSRWGGLRAALTCTAASPRRSRPCPDILGARDANLNAINWREESSAGGSEPLRTLLLVPSTLAATQPSPAGSRPWGVTRAPRGDQGRGAERHPLPCALAEAPAGSARRRPLPAEGSPSPAAGGEAPLGSAPRRGGERRCPPPTQGFPARRVPAKSDGAPPPPTAAQRPGAGGRRRARPDSPGAAAEGTAAASALPVALLPSAPLAGSGRSGSLAPPGRGGARWWRGYGERRPAGQPCAEVTLKRGGRRGSAAGGGGGGSPPGPSPSRKGAGAAGCGWRMFSGGEWRGLCRGLALRDGRAAWQPAALPREKTASHNPSVFVSVKPGCFFSDSSRKGAGGSGQRWPRSPERSSRSGRWVAAVKPRAGPSEARRSPQHCAPPGAGGFGRRPSSYKCLSARVRGRSVPLSPARSAGLCESMRWWKEKPLAALLPPCPRAEEFAQLLDLQLSFGTEGLELIKFLFH